MKVKGWQLSSQSTRNDNQWNDNHHSYAWLVKSFQFIKCILLHILLGYEEMWISKIQGSILCLWLFIRRMTASWSPYPECSILHCFSNCDMPNSTCTQDILSWQIHRHCSFQCNVHIILIYSIILPKPSFPLLLYPLLYDFAVSPLRGCIFLVSLMMDLSIWLGLANEIIVDVPFRVELLHSCLWRTMRRTCFMYLLVR